MFNFFGTKQHDQATAPPQPFPLPDVPDFARQGIADEATIARELNEGPPLTIYSGNDAVPVTLSVRMGLYHSPEIRIHLEQYAPRMPYTMQLPEDNKEALKYLVQWMQTGKIVIPALQEEQDIISRQILTEACFLLWRLWCICESLDVNKIRQQILQQMTECFAIARMSRIATPVSAELIMEETREYTDDKELECEELDHCDFWKVSLQELCKAFTTKPITDIKEYRHCFAIAAFNKVLVPVVGRILRMDSGVEEIDEGRWGRGDPMKAPS
ncbi:uncharacterized protein KY384_001956 [Bacidia gigantensis]|uniref:uncharacterized protein n=1 Tax=Bacidia gigantensis TaxID=2732470 RepID=UPI001D04FEDF|nr:uncharacterized protein KY384_001956 [Bacidia gigantensis]KAG8533173.1 hypothetical protein KY384_001956 [Bacidia gigantensis]